MKSLIVVKVFVEVEDLDSYMKEGCMNTHEDVAQFFYRAFRNDVFKWNDGFPTINIKVEKVQCQFDEVADNVIKNKAPQDKSQWLYNIITKKK